MRVDIKNFDAVVDAPYIGRATVKIMGEPTMKVFGTGTKGLQLKLKIVDAVEQESGMDGLGKRFSETLFLGHAGQKDGGEFCNLQIRKMLNCFGVDGDEGGFDTDDLNGAEGDVIFADVIENNKDGDPVPRNKVVKWLKPVGGDSASDDDGWS